MSISISKFLLALEALFLVFPITVLFSLWASVFFTAMIEPKAWFVMLVILLSSMSLFSGWRLMLAFWLGGSNSLRRVHAAFWFTATAGCIASVLMVLLTLINVGHELRRYVGLLGFGLPLIIPFLHLRLELRRPNV
jgi:hypothetical protein